MRREMQLVNNNNNNNTNKLTLHWGICWPGAWKSLADKPLKKTRTHTLVQRKRGQQGRSILAFYMFFFLFLCFWEISCRQTGWNKPGSLQDWACNISRHFPSFSVIKCFYQVNHTRLWTHHVKRRETGHHSITIVIQGWTNTNTPTRK